MDAYSLFVMTFLILSAFYLLITINVDMKTFIGNYNTINSELVNSNTSKLINADTLNNLPFINILTNNSEINSIRECINNPVKVGDLGSSADLLGFCKSRCGNGAELV